MLFEKFRVVSGREKYLCKITKSPVTIEITRLSYGADTQIRTGDLILTKDALYRLSYISKLYAPMFGAYIVATEKGLEPSTSGVTGRRSNRLNHSATAQL